MKTTFPNAIMNNNVGPGPDPNPGPVVADGASNSIIGPRLEGTEVTTFVNNCDEDPEMPNCELEVAVPGLPVVTFDFDHEFEPAELGENERGLAICQQISIQTDSKPSPSEASVDGLGVLLSGKFIKTLCVTYPIAEREMEQNGFDVIIGDDMDSSFRHLIGDYYE